MWFGLGGFLLAVGATLAWLVSVPVVGIGHRGLGTVLMVAGLGCLSYAAITRWRETREDAASTSGPPST